MTPPSLSIVVTTYERPTALDIVFRALAEEQDQDFEIVVADDGSGPDTAGVVSVWRDEFAGRVVHVWQQDAGFRRSRILNLAAREARGDHFVFIDGDSIPRRGFITGLRRAFLSGWFLASKRLNMSPALSQRILDEQLPVWRWSAFRWLITRPRELFSSPRAPNRPGVLLPIRDRRRPWRRGQPEFSPPYWAYGCFFGVHRHDFERVNGFDMRFVDWGEEDVDMAFRLRRAGLRCGWPGPRATLLHLWHPVRSTSSSRNLGLLRETEAADRFEAVQGLRELVSEPGETQESANRVGASSSSIEPE